MTLDHTMDAEMTPVEMERLKSFDSTLYGQLDFNNQEGVAKRSLLVKGAQYLENEMIRSNKMNTPVSPSLLCSLGHIQLLLEDFPKALSAYQKYYNTDAYHWQNPAFLYGLGIVYSHFNQHQWAIQSFQQILYCEPNFIRASDVHFRIGLIKKNNEDYETATKHFRLALNDSNSSTYLKAEVRFHGAHIYELQGNIKQAKMLYEQLVQAVNSPNPIKANAFRQLGWMYHSNESLGDVQHREVSAIEYLKKSLDSDDMNGQSWYYLGRCYSTIGKVHEAFVAYRQSIDKSEASADTWCSIGILYQQQSQPMDALQAYICAVQLDKQHTAAWTNLGLLYEANSQPKDALHCYQNAVNTNPKKINPNVTARVTLLQNQLNKLTAQQLKDVISSQHQALPCIDEAFHLPIPAELTSRQQGGIVGGAPPQGYNAVSGGVSPGAGQPGTASPKKRKPGNRKKDGKSPDAPPPFLNPQQMNMLHYLQQNQNNLNPQQQTMLHQLRQQYFAQQQYLIQQQQQSQNQLPESMDTTADTSSPEKIKDDHRIVPPASDTPVVKKEIITAPYPLPTNISSQRQSIKSESKINLSMSAKEILESCKDHNGVGLKGSPNICPNTCRPPLPPLSPEPTAEQLTPPTPTITVDCKKDALSNDLKRVSMAQPIVLIKGLAAALRMNLGLFSTKTLVDTAPEHPCEVRTQRKFNVEESLDNHGIKTWRQESTRTSTTIARYAQYQASSFQESLAEETGRNMATGTKSNTAQKSTSGNNSGKNDSDSDSSTSSLSGKKKLPPFIRFGTNVDLSDREKWKEQLTELQKLPHWLRVHWAGNGLSHLGHTVLGMNSVQLYMKIPGCRTPAHQENLNMCSINFNIGPGDCEWFSVPDNYWGALYQLCENNNVDYLSGAWWPLPEDLIKAKIPLYRFTQKPGDLVWISPGTVHWVQATGWCNNIAWNSCPLDIESFKLAIERYEFNKLQSYKSIVPMIHLCWNLAKNVKMSNPELLNLAKYVCMKSLEHTGQIETLMSSKGKHIIWHGRQEGEAPHYCFSCELEVYNILFVREVEKKHVVYCLDCALKISTGLEGFVMLREHLTEHLSQLYDSFELKSSTAATETVTSLVNFTPQHSTAQTVQ